ncbi:Rieske (2Fe-2S) protein [Bradyrhizobium symbiodeficiens]|uniref:Rieske (2Fe-2S) protein n=1 Tax=Bradyrhizobium symbiodeficiens TaxID=1404367 RepID=A0ABX5W6G0_9BRAD|nr:Rieske (2Fe-2S) protein [Bradyrhizobium symbiodeficiens]QDF38808.1 Rieske (2Fe-2S) protein [Bradyrhizobium symbiodeficiens]
MTRHIVCAVKDLPAGQRQMLWVRGREIVVFNHGGEFFALLNKCPHEGGRLGCGKLVGLVESSEPGTYRYSRRGELLKCPWHGWEFDIRTGQSWCDPSKIKTKTYPVAVEAGTELTKGPYVLEKFDVLIEQDYVLIEV